MDKGAIERFAISARNKLRHSVELKMTGLGVNPSHPMKVDVVGNYVIITDPNSGIETRLTSQEDGWRNKLLVAISQNGYDNIVESVAYTWFNRLIAIRYMEVNNYLPSRVRVLSSIVPDKKEPDIVSQCLSVRLNFTNSEKEEIARLNDEERSDELFAKLFLIQCRDLNKILPELFTITKPYENMLFDISYTDPNGVVRDLIDNIPEEDFKDAVQIIGWMYQYYNTELKDDTFAKLKKNVKISKERIPSVTQLFTPDWIVRYMVENSVGRIWLDGHPDEGLKSKWKYYMEEAQQTAGVNAELFKLRKEKANMSPEDITVIDPCMGSGHILVYAFDVLVQIYESYGYSKEDAAVKIVEKNLYGLDIDDRAYQLAYFAVMMKARQYNNKIFDCPVENHIFALVESDIITDDVFVGFGSTLSEKDKTKAQSEIDYLVRTFRNAKTYGSLIKVRELDWNLINAFLNDHGPSLVYTTEVSDRLITIINIGKCLSSNYSVVVTNPPYLGHGGMNDLLSKYVADNYFESKTDLFACFITRCGFFAMEKGYYSLITQHAWMFLSSFEKLRNHLEQCTIINMAHQGPRGFDDISGEVVQTTAWVEYKYPLPEYIAAYSRLVVHDSESKKEEHFLNNTEVYYCNNAHYSLFPGKTITYWAPPEVVKLLSHTRLQDVAIFKEGITTANNDLFLRFWFEVSFDRITFNGQTNSSSPWVPYNKGGSFRKWYGNNLRIINWGSDGEKIKQYPGSSFRNSQYQLNEGGTFSALSTHFSARYSPNGFAFDSKGTMFFSNELDSVLTYLNSKVFSELVSFVCPTLDFRFGTIQQLPYLKSDFDNSILIEEAKKDWDTAEISWDYQRNSLINTNECLIQIAIEKTIADCNNRHLLMKNAEEKVNKNIIDKYCLSTVITPEINDEDVSIEIPSRKKLIVSLISYSVGCMFGRYSLDAPGLCYAGGTWDSSKYSSFIPDSDNIIPINDEEYFGDDIVTYFERFIETVFGKETLEENLKYIANALEIKGSGTAREKIRKYFLNDFYKDHLQMYQKCPIYWLFDSGKANGFKALIYMHRYTPDLIGKMRQNYLLKMQRIYDEQYGKERDQVRRTAIRNKLDEIERYDLAMELYASKNVEIDLDDGVKHNYALFQGIENSKSSKDKIDLLYRI